MLELQELLAFAVEKSGSDLHIKAGSPPHLRIDGRLTPSAFDPVEPADTERILSAILPADRVEEFTQTSEADFAYSVAGLGRFRVSAYRQRGSVGLVFRRVLTGMPAFESLGLPGVVQRLADEPSGLVLVTGPARAGRTTTLACMVDHINATRAVNIVTIEDPIEILHSDRKAIINQRELGTDTRDYIEALRHAMRQDPDVIVIGELRDHEVAWAALGAAEAGHLVLSTMQTTNTTDTIVRLIDFFPPFSERQIRQTLANTLRGIVSQRLLERADGCGQVPAVEALVMSPRILERILEAADAAAIEEVLADGEYYGMQTFDQSLFSLAKDGLVSVRDVMAAAAHPAELRISLETAGLATPA